jgi:hypothetical protein
MRSSLILLALSVVACSGQSSRFGNGNGNGDDGGGGVRGGAAGASSGGRATGGVSSAGRAVGGTPSGGDTSSGGGGAGARPGGTGPDEPGGAPSGGSSGGSDPAGGASGAAGGGITTCSGEFPFVGIWSGDRLDFFFEPMEPVELVVSDTEDGLVGTLRWGEGDPPPEPTNADDPPLGFENGGSGGMGAGGALRPGFAYTVRRGAACDGTFRFQVSADEIHGPWCALQAPVFTSDFGWGCTLQGGGSSDSVSCTVTTNDGQSAMYPAYKCFACAFGRPICSCDENACRASEEGTHVFDLRRVEDEEGEVLTGPDPSCPDCTIRLRREE